MVLVWRAGDLASSEWALISVAQSVRMMTIYGFIVFMLGLGLIVDERERLVAIGVSWGGEVRGGKRRRRSNNGGVPEGAYSSGFRDPVRGRDEPVGQK